MTHDRHFHGGPERLRAPERVARLELDRVLALALEGIEAASALDVGTGTGLFAEAFAARGLAVAGIDDAPEMLEIARAHVPAGDFRQAVAEALPFEDGSFDLVFLGLVLHEATDPVRALREARRVARRRVVVLEWPDVEEEEGPPRGERLSAGTIATLVVDAGFAAIEVEALAHTILWRMAP